MFNLFDLLALAVPNEGDAKRMLAIHGWLANLLALPVCAHFGAALLHYFIRKDGMLRGCCREECAPSTRLRRSSLKLLHPRSATRPEGS